MNLRAHSCAVRGLQPALSNMRKRQVRARRLHMLDSGLACALLGIWTADELALHPMRGSIFDSFVHAELAKWREVLRPSPGGAVRLMVVYAGDRAVTLDGVDFVPWNAVGRAPTIV